MKLWDGVDHAVSHPGCCLFTGGLVNDYYDALGLRCRIGLYRAYRFRA